MKTYDEWFIELKGCTEEQFLKWYLSNYSDVIKRRQRIIRMTDGAHTKQVPLYMTPEEEVEAVRKHYHERYRNELDRKYLDRMELTFSDWLEGYYHLTPETLHKLCEATGTTYREESRIMQWYQRRYMEYTYMKELDSSNPFKK